MALRYHSASTNDLASHVALGVCCWASWWMTNTRSLREPFWSHFPSGTLAVARYMVAGGRLTQYLYASVSIPPPVRSIDSSMRAGIYADVPLGGVQALAMHVDDMMFVYVTRSYSFLTIFGYGLW